jgi:ectoine hydroxylase-related dioxygenase (phytanoyl-CoA dioxygenase family)
MNENNFFLKSGEIKYKKILSSNEIIKLKNEHKKYIKPNLRFGKDINFLNKKEPTSLHRLEKNKSSFFYKLATKKKFFNISKKLTGKECRLHSIQFFMKNSSKNLPTPNHQDNAYWCFKNGSGLSFWIALNKTSKKNGCLYYYPGTHMKDVKHIPSIGTPGSSLKCIVSKKYKKKNYSLQSGDCVVHHSRTIHGSFKNLEKKDRTAFIVSFVTKDSKQDKLLKKNYEKNLERISKINLKKIN